MDSLITLGRMLGFSFAAGINLYATVAILGLASRFGWVALPPQFKVFDNNLIIGAAIVMYLVEFVADKVPWFDSVWDAIHTVIRPVGGAFIAVAALGHASPMVEGLVALLGGAVAASSHLTKAGTRVAVNASPEPFSNWILSLLEDLFVMVFAWVTLAHPVVALAVAIVLLILIAIFARSLVRAVGRVVRTRKRPIAGASVALIVAAGLLMGGRIHAAPQARQQQPPPPAQGQQAEQPGQKPTFRIAANYVRVDVYPTSDGRPVADLKAEDFEVQEDGAPQKVETFEHVVVRTATAEVERVEPTSVREANQMAAEARARLFVLFLDTYHVNMASAHRMRLPIIKLLDRVIGPDDMVAVMTPEMSPRDVTFARKTTTIEGALEPWWTWGRRDYSS